MHWYGGSIAEAVTLSKQRNAIFVVFVEGDNDLSAEMAATIDDSVVLARLSDPANFLAVKLKSGSANYAFRADLSIRASSLAILHRQERHAAGGGVRGRAAQQPGHQDRQDPGRAFQRQTSIPSFRPRAFNIVFQHTRGLLNRGPVLRQGARVPPSEGTSCTQY